MRSAAEHARDLATAARRASKIFADLADVFADLQNGLEALEKHDAVPAGFAAIIAPVLPALGSVIELGEKIFAKAERLRVN